MEFFLGGSKFQTIVSLSSTESKFNATSEAGKNTLYLHSILGSLHVPHPKATPIYEDNAAAIVQFEKRYHVVKNHVLGYHILMMVIQYDDFELT